MTRQSASPGLQTNAAALLNLVVPGLGIILVGPVWSGLLVGVLFAACANFALWATLLIPDEFSPWIRGLGIGIAGGTYLGAQLRLAQAVRERQRQQQAQGRRTALAAVRECLQRNDYLGALRAITPVRDSGTHDLLVAHRVAQILTGLKRPDAALAAWQRLRELDHHGIYSAEARASMQVLARLRDRSKTQKPANADQA